MADSSDLIDQLLNPIQTPTMTGPEQVPGHGPSSNIVDHVLGMATGQDRDQQMNAARARHYDLAEPAIVTLARGIPFASTAARIGIDAVYSNAKQRIAAGTGTPSDYDTVARYDAVSFNNQNTGLSGELTRTVAGLPAVVGEFAAGGAALRAVGVGATAAQGASTAARVTNWAGRTAAQTAVVPSMWAPQWTEDNLRNNRDALDPRGLPPALAMGFLNTAVLGSLGGVGNSITGNGIRPVASRLIARTATGMLEQAGVDAFASAVSEVLPEAYRLNTGYGLGGDILRGFQTGNFDPALHHAFTQAVTFAAFSALHEYQSPHQAMDDIKRNLDESKKAGATHAQAAVALLDQVHEKMQAFGPFEQRAQQPRAPIAPLPAGQPPGIPTQGGGMPRPPGMLPAENARPVVPEQPPNAGTGPNLGVPAVPAVASPGTMNAPAGQRERLLARLTRQQAVDAASDRVPKERTSGASDLPIEHAQAIENARSLTKIEKDALTSTLSGGSYRDVADQIGTSHETVRKNALKAFDKLKKENPGFMPEVESRSDFLQELRLRQLERQATAPAQAAEPSRGHQSVLDQLVEAESARVELKSSVKEEHANAVEHGNREAPSEQVRARLEAAYLEALAVASRQQGNRPTQGQAEPPPGVYAHTGGPSGAAPTGTSSSAIGPHDIIRFINESSGGGTYSGKVPGGFLAGAVIPTHQTIVEGMSKADVPIRIEEMSHHDVKIGGMETDPTRLPHDVADGFLQFLGHGQLSEPAMVEGFGKWAIRRAEGQLTGLSKEQQAANQFAENFLAHAKLTDRYNKLREMVSPNLDPQSQAQGLINATGTSADQTAGTRLESAYDLFVNWLGAAKRMTAEANSLRQRQGRGPIPKGESLETTISGTSFMAPQYAEQFAKDGLFDFANNANGDRTLQRRSGPMSDIWQGFAPADLAPLTTKKGEMPVDAKTSRLGAFILGRSVVSEVTLGTKMLAAELAKPKKAQDASIIEEANRRIATAPANQVEAFRKYIDHEQANDPAFYARATVAAQKYTELNNKTLEVRVNMGTMTDAQKNYWIAAHPDFVSFMRVMDTGTSAAKFGQERHGSARAFVDPFTSLQMRYQKLGQEMVRQLTNEALYKSGQHQGTDQVGVGKFFRVIHEADKPVTNRIELDRQLEALGFDQQMREQMITASGINAIETTTPWRDGATNIYRTMQEGKPVVLEILNRPLYELLTTKEGSNNYFVQGLSKMLELPGPKQAVNALKFGATAGNMAFQTRNVLKDIPTYYQNVQNGTFLKNTADLIRGYGDAYSNKFRALLGMEPNDPRWKMYELGGAEMFRASSFMGEGGIKPITKLKQVLELVGGGEHGPRYAEYLHALEEMGYTKKAVMDSLQSDPNTSPIPLSAHLYARQRAALATVDFSATGSIVKQWNKLDPFFGAHMSSMIQEARNWRTYPQKMAAILGVYFAAELAHWWLYKDDEWYNQLPSHQRHNWFVLGQSGDGQTWGLPKPQGAMRMAGAYFQETLRTTSGNDHRFGMAASTAGNTAIPRLAPIGVGEAFSVAGNQSWSGQPIVPRHAENLEGYQKMLQYQLPYVMEQMTGGLAGPRHAMQAWQSDQGSLAERTGLGILRSPHLGFRVSQTPPHQSVQDFYDLQAELQREHSRASQSGQRSEREREYHTLTIFKDRMDSLGAELRGMRTRSNGGRVQGEMPTEERGREIRASMLDLARRALERVRP